MPRLLLALAVIGLTVYALIDCVRTSDDEVKGLPKLVWVVVILLVPPVGPIGWLLAGRERRARPPRAGAGGPPVGPDDDPDFLRRVEEQRRLQRWEAELRERERRLGPDDGDDGTTRT